MDGGLDAFEEHLAVAEALRANFEAPDDAERVAAAVAAEADIGALLARREGEAAHLVQALTASLSQREAEAQPPPEAGMAGERADALRVALAGAKENAARLGKEARCVVEEREALASHAAGLDGAQARLASLEADAEPRARHALSLYVHLSNAAWADAPGGAGAPPGVVRGTVSDEGARELRRVELDARTLSRFDVVNAVWDVVDGTAGRA